MSVKSRKLTARCVKNSHNNDRRHYISKVGKHLLPEDTGERRITFGILLFYLATMITVPAISGG